MKNINLILSILTSIILAITSANAQNVNGQKATSGKSSRADKRAINNKVSNQQMKPIAVNGDWNIFCDKVKVPADSTGKTIIEKKQCGMTQVIVHKQHKNVGMRVIVVRNKMKDDKGKEHDIGSMRVIAPIGVFLPTGVSLEVDKTPIGSVPFTRCLPNGCAANLNIDGKLLNKFKGGNSANFIIYSAPGNGAGLELSLKGFTKSYDDLPKYNNK